MRPSLLHGNSCIGERASLDWISPLGPIQYKNPDLMSGFLLLKKVLLQPFQVWCNAGIEIRAQSL